MSDQPCCACLSVTYDPERMDDGNRDRWVCNCCGCEFLRGAFVDYWDQKAVDDMAILRHKLVAEKAIKDHYKKEIERLTAESEKIQSFLLSNYSCHRAAGFEGPETFPDCGECFYCKLKARADNHNTERE